MYNDIIILFHPVIIQLRRHNISSSVGSSPARLEEVKCRSNDWLTSIFINRTQSHRNMAHVFLNISSQASHLETYAFEPIDRVDLRAIPAATPMVQRRPSCTQNRRTHSGERSLGLEPSIIRKHKLPWLFTSAHSNELTGWQQ